MTLADAIRLHWPTRTQRDSLIVLDKVTSFLRNQGHKYKEIRTFFKGVLKPLEEKDFELDFESLMQDIEEAV